MEHSGGIKASLGGRYATALFELARDARALDAVEASLAKVRQALTESVVLAFLGGAAGLVVAYGGARLLLHMVSGKSYLPIDAAPSLPVLGFAFALSLITGVLFGTAPAWMTAHTDPIEALRGANRATKQSGLWTQKILVVIQAAVSLALLCAAALVWGLALVCAAALMWGLALTRVGFDVCSDPFGVAGDLADLADRADPIAAEIQPLFAEVPLSSCGAA